TLTASDLSDASRSSNTSPAITITAGSLVKLQLLAPGEAAVPGTSSGKSGTPTARTAGTAFTVTVNGVDDSWNVVNTNDTVGITATDTNATLPASAILVGGARTFSVTLRTAGSATLTSSNSTNPLITSSTSPSIIVNVGAV